jgi:hypothetical protein
MSASKPFLASSGASFAFALVTGDHVGRSSFAKRTVDVMFRSMKRSSSANSGATNSPP